MRRQTAQLDLLVLRQGRGGLASSSKKWKFFKDGQTIVG
jgi:hypothetical protein